MLTLDHFDYHLPEGRIAQTPVEPRDGSKLLALDRQTGDITDHIFRELPDLLSANDVIVRNNTKVIPARIFGVKDTGGQVELLLIKRQSILDEAEEWEVLSKPGLKIGQTLSFPNSDLQATCVEIKQFSRIVRLNKTASELYATLHEIGHTPIPPYIDWEKIDEQDLRQVYQTTYAKIAGSVAAPTAGLHFTKELDERLLAAGIQFAEVTLHVGLGTFLPVKTTDITSHHMHSEYFELNTATALQLNEAKKQGKRIIAVGTTTVRVLESCASTNQFLTAQNGDTSIYIYPPYQFKFVEAMITNFHLPQSTLLMLISAFVSQPNTPQTFTTFAESAVGKAYAHAITNNYRFFSFGDAMLIE